MKFRCTRGAAISECALVVGVVVTIVSATLSLSYLAYARAMIEYQTEQVLYCLAEGRRPATCRANLHRALKDQLRIGRLTKLRATRRRNHWHVEASWTATAWTIHVIKSLDRERILRPGGRWSCRASPQFRC